MPARTFVIFLDPAAGHRIVAASDGVAPPVPFAAPPDATPEQLADAAAESLKAAGYAGQAVVLAIPSAWCLCAAVRTGGLPAKGRRQAMLYRLEENLPVSAEDVVADFIPSGDRALGVCVERRLLAPLVDALESRGVAIEAICPASLLALQRFFSEPLATVADARGADALVWPSGDALEFFGLSDGIPHSWSIVADEPKDLLLHIGLAALDRADPRNPQTILAAGLRRPMLDALAGLPAVRIIECPLSSQETFAAAQAGEALAGTSPAWVDLRRGDLGARDRLRLVRTPLAVAVAAVVLCLVCACGAMLWRAQRYDRLAAAHQAGQRAVFRQVFPTGAEPLDVRSRLESEERGLRGLSGAGAANGAGDPSSTPPTTSAGLLALRDLLTNLPVDVRYRILEVRIDPNRFTIEGQALTHGDADAVAEALRRTAGLTVEPPRTEQLPDTAAAAAVGASPARGVDASPVSGVSFTITGEFVAGSSTVTSSSGPEIGRATR